ncbi:sensor histidine kinase [Sandaracinus amylolyticus]|uniref:histidine kinase n=1 Tax=Sandaracinus amylolyticus TaxID=927083 RepID=A0A0F6YNW6_9BACT|nr:sensor histidine kinase [Sandaracinus amylolyticus]AKF10832.1 Putative two-component system sensor kinase [Sandaracinus amylolyticus]
MLDLVRSLLAEPALARPSRPSRADRGVALLVLALALAEGLLRDHVPSRPIAIAIGLVIAAALLFRGTHPFGAFVAAFASVNAVTALELALGVARAELHTGLAVLLLPYSLFRAASGRQAALGLALMALAYALGALQGGFRHPGDAIGGAVVLLFPAVLGASVRFRDHARLRELDHARLRERERLARELHDTVAHHVAAIAIQAQAGRAVLATRPDATRGALAAIEAEAARTLAELRALVGALRDDDGAALGLAELDALAARAALPVTIERAGELDGLRPLVQSALYRLAQESITNAVRHARGARRVVVRIEGERDVVRLTVRDDGERARTRGPSGYGLVGMAERAALLGGTLEAGPADEGGWSVRAVLPREGGAR